MTRPRVIVVLLIKDGLLVRSQQFRTHQLIGHPMSTIRRLSNWNIDELVLLDISDRDDGHDVRRDDLAMGNAGCRMVEVLQQAAEVCYMPLAVGGRIRTLDDIRDRLEAGADKCVVNTAAIENPAFISAAVEAFGSQCVVVNIDSMRWPSGTCEVMSHRGRRQTGLDPVMWAREVEQMGAGEILLNSLDRDGMAIGYDLDLIRSITEVVRVPVIACGGVGKYAHFAEGILEAGATAVAAANVFHFFELSYAHAKASCIGAGVPVRPIDLGSRFVDREPRYELCEEDRRRAGRVRVREQRCRDTSAKRASMRWCVRCVAPLLSAIPLEIDEEGVCSACRAAEARRDIKEAEWSRRRELLGSLLERYRARDGRGYDCIIPVSGGKDSYYQTHVITRDFGFRPLLVTYNGNNYTEAGWRNVHRMKEVFGVDHIFFSPSVSVLRKLNRLAFEIMGDMNWHSHVGIKTYPVQVAVQTRTPLIVWGEHGQMDLAGQFSMNDYPEMTYRDRLEYYARGYEWTYFVGREGLSAHDLNCYTYPSDASLLAMDVRGIHLGNYIPWEANDHAQMMIDMYGFEVSDEPFERTYRRISNLDDMHENGVHDYLKYIKFGYGRCTDHACKDIRAGRLTRERAIELVREHDHVKPRDLVRWLKYVGMTESEFDRIAETFRDPRVWRFEGGRWIKDNLWDDLRSGTQERLLTTVG